MSENENKNFKKIEKILLKPSKSRTEQNLLKLKLYFSNYKYFKNLQKIGKEKLDLLYKNLKIKKVKNNFIFLYGQKPDKFYFLLKGTLQILVPKDLNSLILNKRKNYNQISILTQGKPFGEMALLAQKERGASVFSEENSIILFLSDKIYIKCIKNKDRGKIEKKIKNLKEFLCFDLDKISVMKISYYFRKKTLLKNFFVFREGFKNDKLYLVLKGEIKLMKKIQVPFYNGFKVLNRKQVLDKEVFTIGRNKFLGLYEFYKGFKNYYFSAKVDSDKVYVYEIDLDKVSHLIANKRFENYFKIHSEKFYEIFLIIKKNIQEYKKQMKNKINCFKDKNLNLKINKNILSINFDKKKLLKKINDSKKRKKLVNCKSERLSRSTIYHQEENRKEQNFIKKISYYKSVQNKFKNRFNSKNPRLKKRYNSQKDINFLSLRENIYQKEKKNAVFKKRIKNRSFFKRMFKQKIFLKKTIRIFQNTEQMRFKKKQSPKYKSHDFRVSLKPLCLKNFQFNIKNKLKNSKKNKFRK